MRKKDSHGSLSQNKSNEVTETAMNDSTKKKVEIIIDGNNSGIKGQIKSQDESKEAKAIKEDKVLEKSSLLKNQRKVPASIPLQNQKQTNL